MAEEDMETPVYVYHTLGILGDDFENESSHVPSSSVQASLEAGFHMTTDSLEESTSVTTVFNSSPIPSVAASGSQHDITDVSRITVSTSLVDGSTQSLGLSEGELDEDIGAIASETILESVQGDSMGLSFNSSSTSEDPAFLSLDVEELVGASLTEQAEEKVKSSDNETIYEAPPWARTENFSGNSFRSPFLQLHQEIVDFCNFVAPTEEEKQFRAAAVERVSAVVKSIWPSCQVKVFGSFATGLFLPTSDCDVVILESGCQEVQDGLKAIAKALNRKSLIKNLQIIGKARVPIIKFLEAESNISFDISFDVANGPDAATFIKDAMSALPPLKPLCMVLKIFLQQRELNEVYTGGIGSYALLVMLMTHLQMHPSRRIPDSRGDLGPLESNLGVLLVDFFDFYGRALNVKEVGISCRSGGRFYTKASRGFVDSVRPYLLSVEDPQSPDNDIGKNSFNVTKVRSAFLLAHRVLTKLEVEGIPERVGILGRIVRMDEKLVGRKFTLPQVPHGVASTTRRYERNTSSSADLRDSRNLASRRSGSRWQDFEDDDFPRGPELDHRPNPGRAKTRIEDEEVRAHAHTPSRNPRYHQKRTSEPHPEQDLSLRLKEKRSIATDSILPTSTRHDERRRSDVSGSTDERARDGKMAKQKALKKELHDFKDNKRRSPDGKKDRGRKQRIVVEEDPIEEGEIVFKDAFPTSVADTGHRREYNNYGEGSGHDKRKRWFEESRSSKRARLLDMDSGSVRSRKKIVTTKLGHKKIVYV